MKYAVRRDANGYACAITRDGVDVLHLVAGSVKNVKHADEIAAALNGPCCAWTEDEDGNWWTGCGNVHVFTDGGPRENDYDFCPYCGKPLPESEVRA